MQELPKKEKAVPDAVESTGEAKPADREEEREGVRSYYYDDAYGYEDYDPEGEDEEDRDASRDLP